MADISEHQYEMGYTPAEFSRVIGGNFSGEKSPLKLTRIDENNFRINDLNSDMIANIEIRLQPPRVLGLISLPVLLVTFKVSSSTDAPREFFFDRFFKYFHKGGG